jgi:hypothetical protein
LQNGIFVFNITKLIAYIEAHSEEFATTNVDVAYYHSLQERSEFNKEYVQQADLAIPVILAEIAPGRFEMGILVKPSDYNACGYNLIDGQHRVP